jgi:hypothetical protein
MDWHELHDGSTVRGGLVAQRLLALSLVLSSSLCGCHAREPEYARDPEGVSRSAKPQVVIKKEDVYIDGHLIRMRSTTAEEAKALTGKDQSDPIDNAAFFNATGLRIDAGVDDQIPGRPKLVHSFQVWVRQDNDSSIRLVCNTEDLKRHEEYKQLRIKSLERFEQENHFAKDEAARIEVMNETCSVPGKTPGHAFSGYLEVDGVPIGPNMSIKEIQTRRKRVGLEPLYQDSGPQFYVAPRAKTGPEWNQTWIFEVTVGDGGVILDQRLKAITIP